MAERGFEPQHLGAPVQCGNHYTMASSQFSFFILLTMCVCVLYYYMQCSAPSTPLNCGCFLPLFRYMCAVIVERQHPPDRASAPTIKKGYDRHIEKDYHNFFFVNYNNVGSPELQLGSIPLFYGGC